MSLRSATDDGPTGPPDPSKSSICHPWGASREVPVLHRGRLCPPGGPLETLAEFFADALPAIRGSSTASSSMRPGPRPKWSAHMVGTERTAPARTSAARALANAHIPCFLAATRLASLMDRSTAKGSKPITRSSSCRRSSPPPWSSWTISAATRAMRCAWPFVAARLLFLPRYSS
jgi:hypothetical protein